MELDNEYLKNKIIGTWKLLSWTYDNNKGETIDYFGTAPTGILMYDSTGYMNAQLMKNDRAHFKTEILFDGSDLDKAGAFQSYLAYYGKYKEISPGEFVHYVEGSLFPNWIGTEHIRYGSIHDDKLILRTPSIPTEDGELVFTVTWQRL